MGRTPHTPRIHEAASRDHHVNGYSIFSQPVASKVALHTEPLTSLVTELPKPIVDQDIHATVFHQLGLDHERLTYRFGGRDVSLTDVHGHVVQDLLTNHWYHQKSASL